MFGPRLPYRYDHYTWLEMRDVVKRQPQPVVIVPVGSVEDHGHHLPLDVDNFTIGSICEEAAKRAPNEILLLPGIPYGFETHHMEFPGTIDIKPRHLEDFVVDVTTSVAHHGFRRILLADGHGSNMPILNIAARRTVLETEALCAAFIWPSIIPDAIKQIRESPRGGMAHACELETSLYLHLNRNAVQMDKAVPDYNDHRDSQFHWQDLEHGSKIVFMDWWSRISKTGTIGDPTLATAEKGKIVFEASVSELIKLVREFRDWTSMPRRELH